MATVRKVTPTATKTATKTAAAKPATTKSAGVKPAATGTRATTSRTKTTAKASGIAVFIDLDNTGASLTNVQEVISILKNQGTITYGKFYGYTDERSHNFEEVVRENKFETAGKLRLKNGAENVMDVRLIVDAMNMTAKNKFESIFIWLANGDLVSLFAHFQEIGLKTLTPDLPSVDCKNKFVTTAVKMYSAHTIAEPKQLQTPVQAPIMPSSEPVQQLFPQSSIEKKIMEESPVPALPRKKDAPEFGQKLEDKIVEPEVDEDDREMTDEEMDMYLKTIALQTIMGNRVSEDIKPIATPQIEDDFGGLQNTLPEIKPVKYETEEETQSIAVEEKPVQEDDAIDSFAMPPEPSPEFPKQSDFGYDMGEDKALKEEQPDGEDDEDNKFTDFGDDFGDLIKR